MSSIKELVNDSEIEKNLKHISSKRFSLEIEQIVKNNKSYDYIGTIINLAKTYSIDLEEINKFVSKPLLQKLEAQCNKERLLKDSIGFNSKELV